VRPPQTDGGTRQSLYVSIADALLLRIYLALRRVIEVSARLRTLAGTGDDMLFPDNEENAPHPGRRRLSRIREGGGRGFGGRGIENRGT